MKKIFTLVLIAITVFTAPLFAQPGSICNAEFTFSVNGSNNTVQFTPVTINTSAMLQHHWDFGDGQASNFTNPSHVYAAAGTYSVLHISTYRSPNDSNIIACVDSFTRVVTIAGQQPCNINASFSFVRDSVQTNMVYFTNLSTGTTPNTVTRWNFGDGTISYDNNPVHVFQTSGVYNVCLLVRRDSLCASDTCAMVQVQAPVNNCNLVVNFSTTPDSVNPNTIHFTNLSTPLSPVDSVTWIFGDGSVSHEVNATHTFVNAGVYNVCLVVKKSGNSAGSPACIRESCRQIAITTSACNIIPGFVFIRDTTTAAFPAAYRFYNTTQPFSNTDSSFWNFGDGSPIVINPNNPVTHVYSAPGVYVVCLLVKKVQAGTINIICERQICQTIMVDTPQTACNLQSYFSYMADSSFFNKIYFTNQTNGVSSADSIRWTFGDGSSSTQVNPTHTYNVAGTYQVCLRVQRPTPAGTMPCVDEYCRAVVVREPVACNLTVNFFDSSINNNTIYFINQSAPLASADSIRWTFGDGTASNAVNPIHTFNQPGLYTVCLRVKKASVNGTPPCVREYCRVVEIRPIVNPCDQLNVNFVWRTDSANRRKVYFTNTSTPATTAAYSVWSFGDGTSSTGWNADHVYAMPGWYLVCLTVTSGNTCTRTACDSIFIPGNVIPPVNCDSFRLEIGHRRDNYMPNKLYFFATGNAPVYNQQWSFTKEGDSASVIINQSNPVYVFPDTGVYSVCVRAAFSTNCIKERCEQIRIYSTSTPPQCILNSYPNPAHNIVSFNVQMDQPGLIGATVMNMQGVALMQFTQTGFTGNNTVTMNIQNLATGFYTVRITYNGRVCYTRFQKI